ncbi:putative aspartic peptidase domain superfamily [Helianthus annuus]|nr:putative aspartic peptidase domain superfamily [Helianthus annuus]KAJ0506879.1 putative aspartic peptidase domain superfamily [Helianthus annuus]KAJ0676517.1 putative aspartic peptidase domain superfamily [Helianthus annuus]
MRRKRGQGLHMTAAEAKAESDVVSGIFLVNSIPARILFGTGVNSSFVSYRFIQHPTFMLTKLPMPLEVEIGTNKSFIVCDMCWNCKLSIDDEEYFVDLIPMSMGELQVVIGMDWLARYHVKVICNRKEIQLMFPSGKHVTIYGEKSCSPIICSFIKAYKLVQHGCKAYMAYIHDSTKESLEIKDVPVIREFEDVFLEDLPGVPPEREVEFGIKLVPRAKPIAKAP